ncbi:MAG: alpha/beta hydrolase [Myxococcota bacterium]
MKLSAALGLTLFTALASACARREPPSAERKPAREHSLAAPLVSQVANPVAPEIAEAAPRGSDSEKLPRMLPAEERTWTFENTPVGRMDVVVVLPERTPYSRWPVLITMHGRGEALKGPERGARGWIDDYDLLRAIKRVRTPPLMRDDFKSFVKESRRSRLNAALTDKPWRGFIIVCPYTPDVLTGDDPFGRAPPLAQFLVDELLPRVYRETPALGTPESTGIDGVSLGGRAAFSVGLLRPRAFGVVAGLQVAFHTDKANEIAERARQAREQNPKLIFRILTSDEDVFLGPDTAIADAMRAASVPLYFDVVTGPHDYDFNKGPGAIEMLLFHDRVLRGESPP